MFALRLVLRKHFAVRKSSREYAPAVLAGVFLLAHSSFAQTLRFVDVTSRARVATPADPNGYGHGVTVADFNGDALPDIYVVSYDADNALFINNGNGTFTDHADQAGVLSGSRLDRGVAAADYDNDGDPDFYVAAGAGHHNLLFVNDGKGSFFDFALEARVRLNNFQGQGVSWGDYDNDGDLDLFLPSFDDPARLFRQEADHTFTEVTEQAGIVHSDHSVQSVFFDFDLDGDLDIFMSRGEGFENRLFVNQGNGTFADEAAVRNVADPEPHGQGLAVADYDGDGDLDIYMSNANGGNRLYRNDAGWFAEIAETAGVHDGGRSLGCMFADFDNDGWPDLYVGNFGRNRIFRNDGHGTFTDETEGAGTDGSNRAYGTSTIDYDADGRLDIFFSNSGQPSKLLHNVGPARHWLKIALTGRQSNRSGVGARIAVTSGGRRQLQQLIAGSSMVSGGSDLAFHFGLGAEAQAERVEVFWPSGARDVLQEVAGDRAISIVEGSYGVPPADTTAPQISEIIVETNGQGNATISWTTDEPATAQVEYGLTERYGTQTAPLTALSLYHTARITGLAGQELYYFRVRSQDAAGNLAISESKTVQAAPIVLPLIVYAVEIQNVSGSGAEIAWRTHGHTTCTVTYGTTTSYGLQLAAFSADGLSHRAKLDRLFSNSGYHFQITARYGQSQSVRSRDYAFKTLVDDAPPLLSNISTEQPAHSSVTIVWDTNEPATSQVEFGRTTNYGRITEVDSSWRTHHEVKLANLEANNLHHFRVLSRDAAGNLATSNDFSFQTLPEPDTNPPQLSNIEARSVSTNRATIVWDTDERSTSRVEYGTNTDYGDASQDNSLSTYHEIELADLAANTTYHFRVQSRDAAGNLAVSGDFNFTTERSGGGSTITVTDDFNRGDIGSAWTLDDRFWEISNGELAHSSQATGSWRYLAVFNRVSNGNGRRITEVSYRWGREVDEIGVREGAMALMLDQDSPHASGYWIWHRYNQVWLWTIVNGEYVGGHDLGHFSGSGDPVAGDVVTVVIREESDANYFDYYINGRYSATASDPAKHFPRSENWYAGVFMRGEGVRNACDDFSVTYVQESANLAPVVSGIRAGEIGSASARIFWTTDVAAETKVEYRLAEDASWLSATPNEMTTSHSLLLDHLLPNRSYRYRIWAGRGTNQSAVSAEYQFVTKPDNGDLANNVELLSFLPLRGEPTLGNVWGYADAGGEYALVCLRQNGLAIVEVTDPRRPRRVASVTSFYGDLKEARTFEHYAVAINEFGAMQIIDLADPRRPELVAMYQESFSGGHNLFISGHYAYVVGTHPPDPKQDDPTGLHIIDLSDPTQPKLAGKREGFYIHDLYVENDTAYVLGYLSHRVHIWDVREKNNIREITSFPYHGPHSVRRSHDKKTLLLTDEGRGQDVQLWDIGDLHNIHQVGRYMTDPQIAPHTIEVVDRLAFIAYFEDMLRIIDHSDPASPVEVGFYDTYPQNPSHGQPNGAHQTAAWGVYPHAPSGNIYLSDMTKGLYVFRYVPPGPAQSDKAAHEGKRWDEESALSDRKELDTQNVETLSLPQHFALSAYPNPFQAGPGTRLRLQMPGAAQIYLSVFDILGRTVKEITAGDFAGGVHEIHWRGENQEGRSVTPGIYIMRLRYHRAGEQTWMQLTQKMVVAPH